MWQENRHRTSFDYICCSDSEKPPELTAISCSSPADCEMVKKLIFENVINHNITIFFRSFGFRFDASSVGTGSIQH
jgi:hypothetical protein